MRNGICFLMCFFAFLSTAQADCVWFPTKIDTLGIDSFYVKTLAFDGITVTRIDTITRGRFINDLLKRFDSSNVAFIGFIDTVQRINFNDGTKWRFKDSIKVKVDTLLKGQSLSEFWTSEIDPLIECDGPGLPGVAQCAVIAGDDYKSYSSIAKKRFILLAKQIDNLRTTSISPSGCRGDYGNYLTNDTISSDYPERYPALQIPLQEFLLILNAHTDVRYRPINRDFHLNLNAYLSTSNARYFDISGKLVYRSSSHKTNVANGIYLLKYSSDKMRVVLQTNERY